MNLKGVFIYSQVVESKNLYLFKTPILIKSDGSRNESQNICFLSQTKDNLISVDFQ